MEINEIVREDYTTLATAARVMRWGLKNGSFTTKELREYLSTMHESHKTKAVLEFLRGYGFVTVTEEKFDTGIPAKRNCHCEEEYMLPRGTKISLTEYAKLPTELREIVATISTKTEPCRNIIGTRYHYTVNELKIPKFNEYIKKAIAYQKARAEIAEAKFHLVRNSVNFRCILLSDAFI